MVFNSGSYVVTFKLLTLSLSGNTSVILPTGGNVDLIVSAVCNDRSRHISYQWSKDGVDISAATGTRYKATSTGSYTLTATVTDDSSTPQTITRTISIHVIGPPPPLPIQLKYSEKIGDKTYQQISTVSSTRTLYIAKGKNNVKITVIFDKANEDISPIRWSGLNGVSANNGKRNCTIANTSSSTDGALKMSYIKRGHSKIISMNLKFVEITKVEEDPNQKYGFDDYSVKIYNASKSTYIEDKIWKSIAKNDSDSFFITLSHADAWKEIKDNKKLLISISDDDKIKSVDVATGNAKSKITVNSKNKGEANFKLRLAGGELEVEVTTSSDGDNPPDAKRNLAEFGVVVYEKKNYTVNYKVINDPDTDGAGPDTNITTTLPSSITKTSLEDGLNKIYQQGVVSWNVTDSGTQDIMFDTNNNGKLNDFNKKKFFDSMGNVTNISYGEYDIINNTGEDNSFDRNIFFVEGVQPGRLGINPKFGRFIDVHPSSHGNLQKIIITTAHELGHSLKLKHVDKTLDSRLHTLYGYTPIFSVLIDNASDNLMLSYKEGAVRLLKKQWDKINK